MEFVFLENFGKDRPQFDVNMARMRNDAHPEKITLFVEGEDDRNFFRSFLKDRSRWKIEYGPKKKGVLERYQKYLENPTVPFAMFSVDLDYDYAVELFQKKGKDARSCLIEDSQFFYQLFDVSAKRGYNDLEAFLFMSDAYSSMMVEYYDDDEIIEGIRVGILNVGLVMGIVRVANILARRELDLPEGSSMLCHEKNEDGGCRKFDAGFMESFGLVDFGEMSVSPMDMVCEMLTLEFGGEKYGRHLPLVIKIAHEILTCINKKREYSANLLRGHDLMDLLVRKMVYDRGRRGSSFKSKRKPSVEGPQDLEKFRDELESDLRKAAGNALEELKQFPLGCLLK